MRSKRSRRRDPRRSPARAAPRRGPAPEPWPRRSPYDADGEPVRDPGPGRAGRRQGGTAPVRTHPTARRRYRRRRPPQRPRHPRRPPRRPHRQCLQRPQSPQSPRSSGPPRLRRRPRSPPRRTPGRDRPRRTAGSVRAPRHRHGRRHGPRAGRGPAAPRRGPAPEPWPRRSPYDADGSESWTPRRQEPPQQQERRASRAYGGRDRERAMSSMRTSMWTRCGALSGCPSLHRTHGAGTQSCSRRGSGKVCVLALRRLPAEGLARSGSAAARRAAHFSRAVSTTEARAPGAGT